MRGLNAFKYLVILTSDLSWSCHVESICTKARKVLGHRRFYKHAEPTTLLTLSFIGKTPPSDIWDPHLQRDRLHIENVD